MTTEKQLMRGEIEFLFRSHFEVMTLTFHSRLGKTLSSSTAAILNCLQSAQKCSTF